MAYRAQPIKPHTYIFGGLAVALLVFLTLGTLVAVWLWRDISAPLTPSDWAAIRFTLIQAGASASISVGLAIFVARALARRVFWGRAVMVALLGAPFILPAIVAVFALIAVWGRTGWVSSVIGEFGFMPLNIYGFIGVVLAHVFFNLPLATRLILQGWLAIPTEQFRLCAQLGMESNHINKILERPILRSVVPSSFVLIFLLCVSSFAVALALGGGPRATTIELAIYQSLRFDFDLGKAANLAMIQFGLCAVLSMLAVFATRKYDMTLGLDSPPKRWDGRGACVRIFDAGVLILTAGFLFLPLGAIGLRGLAGLFVLPDTIWRAGLNSVLVAGAAMVITIAMTLALSNLIIRLLNTRKNTGAGIGRVIESFGVLILSASPFVMGTGLFIIINRFINPFDVALGVVILVNALMSIPFALRILLPAMIRAEASYGRLGTSLGMTAPTRFRLCIWPRLRRPMGFAAGLALALSMGDLGVIALFAPPNLETLPLLMYRLMESYQIAAAGGVALCLVGLSFGLFWLCDKGGRIGDSI